MRSGCNLDTLTSVDIREDVQFGGKLTNFFEGVI